eukprot:m.377863 g.377863  ORF g.377863 m.377863 type:complete len:356 (+) comp20927_c1_seq3:976-2043(+)
MGTQRVVDAKYQFPESGGLWSALWLKHAFVPQFFEPSVSYRTCTLVLVVGERRCTVCWQKFLPVPVKERRSRIGQSKVKQRGQSRRHKELCYMGYRFEGYATSMVSGPDARGRYHVKPPDRHPIVNTKSEYVSVFTSKLGSHRLLLAGEVDCCALHEAGTNSLTAWPPPLGSRTYVELKTSALIHRQRQSDSFEKHKLLKYWAQSFLPNVPRVVVGFRDEDGFVQKKQTFRTQEIPRLIKGKEDRWSAAVCMNFLSGILSWVNAYVTQRQAEGGAQGLYLLAYNGGDMAPSRSAQFTPTLTLRPLTEAGQFPELACNDGRVLPSWFVEPDPVRGPRNPASAPASTPPTQSLSVPY